LSRDTSPFSLLDQLSEGGFQASVIASYSCYFPFYEEVVLRRLLDKGCATNVLLVDAGQCAEAFASEDRRPRRAGFDYTLIPVQVAGAFHPKLIMTVGKSKGALFVGSHNMTLAGFGLNDEITNVFHTRGVGAREGAEPIRRALDYLESFVPADALPDLTQVFATLRRGIPWLEGPVTVESQERVLLTSTGSDEDLWSRVRPLIPHRVSTVFVCGPFFDRNLRFLQRLLGDVRPSRLVVGVDPESVEIDPVSVSKARGAEFVNIAGLPAVPNRRERGTRYMHAKALWLVGPGHELLVTGSANPSAPAFLEGGSRNAEAIVVDQREGAAKALGLDDLLGAPAVTEGDWSRVAERRAAEIHDRASSTGTLVLAVPTPEGFLLERPIGAEIALDGIAADGTVLGEAASGSQNETLIDASASLRDGAQTLRSSDSKKSPIVVLVHRPDQVARRVGGDHQKDLRQALGALDEDPSQLETALRLVEKVIFDADEVVLVQSPLPRKGKRKIEPQPAQGPESLAVAAFGRRGGRRKKSLASGDILVLLDALMYRLGEGLPGTGPARPPVEEVMPPSDEDADDEELKLPRPLDKLAESCRRKVGRLVRRMKAQLEVANQDGAARRAIIQLAAVLSVVHMLRTMEKRTEWRTRHLKLVDPNHQWQLFEVGALAVGWGCLALGPRSLKEGDCEPFEELSLTVGLLTWLAWDVGIDVVAAAATRTTLSEPDDQGDPWDAAQLFACVAAQLAHDSEARDVLQRAVARTGRRGDDGAGWLQSHLGLAERIMEVQDQPETLVRGGRVPSRGDLVILSPNFDPRVRVALDVQPSGSTYKVRVLDREMESGERYFLVTHVATAEWWQHDGSSSRAGSIVA